MLPDPIQNHPVLSRYRDVRSVGRGAFGHVFRAEDPQTGRAVAIKVLRLGQAQEVLHRFSREAQAQSRLESPYLVRLLDMDTEHEPPSLVMEWIPGGTLDQRYPVGQPAPPDEARRVARDLLRGIGVLHGSGLLHRDLKPANVFFREDGTAVLGDLGLIGEEVASTISRTGQALGTPRYMPPEVLQGLRWSPAGDLFAAGITLWEFTTGVHPNTFFEKSLTLFLRPDLRLPTLEEAGAYRNPCLQALLDGLLALAPEERPQSSEEALALLGTEEEACSGDAEALAGHRPRSPGGDQDDLDDEDAETQIGPAARLRRTREAPTEAQATEAAGHRPPTSSPSPQESSPSPADPEVLPGGAGGALLPRAVIATVLGGILVLLAGLVALFWDPAPSLPRTSGTSTEESARAFPQDFHPGLPWIRFLDAETLELRWETPVAAYARGSGRSDQGIQEFERGRSSRPTRLEIPAPREGDAYRELHFVLVDRSGQELSSEIMPQARVPSLPEAARDFLRAHREGADPDRLETLWSPLRDVVLSGTLARSHPDLQEELARAGGEL